MVSVSLNQPAVTLSVRISPAVRTQLEELSTSTARTKSFLAAEAIEQYLVSHAWQIKAIETSLAKANTKDANFISHDKVAAWLNSWGSKKERQAP